MQYFINIPQITLTQYETLDISHACILYFMRQFIGEENMDKHTEEGKTWYWFATQKIIDELPLLRITCKRVMRRKINEIIKTNLVERKVDCNKTYYSFTEAFFEIYRGSKEVYQICPTRSDNFVPLGIPNLSDNHNTNINIPNHTNIFKKEAFDKFWNLYPQAKEEHRASALVFFVKNNLDIHILDILKATEHYAQSKKAQEGFIYNPLKFLESVYPSYVQENLEEKNVKPSQKLRNDGAVLLLEKMAWLDERWEDLGGEAKRAIIQSDGEIIAREGETLFNAKEIEAIRKAGGLEVVLYSHLTQSTHDQLARLLI